MFVFDVYTKMPRRSEVIRGSRFGRYTVIQDLGIEQRDNYSVHVVLARCDCGRIKKVQRSHLISGHIKSCGCYNAEKSKHTMSTHGQSSTRLYGIWKDMKKRCSNPNHIGYKNYGGRGISVCAEWNSFDLFYQWAINSGYDESLSIDRIDVDGSYSPQNCRWATRIIQSNNTRKQKPFVVMDSYGNKTKYSNIKECSEKLGLKRKNIVSCLNGRQHTTQGYSMFYI